MEVARREKFQLRAFVTHFSWKLPVFQVLVINILYSHCCFKKPFSQVLLHLHDDLHWLSIWHLWEGIGMRGGHRDHSAFLVSEVKVTSNHLITPKQALPITHLASASINPHVPSFHIQGGKRGNAEEVWERLAASRRSQGANIFQGEASRRHQGQVKARWPPSKAAPNYQEEGSSPG